MPGREVAGVEALDCKDVALPVAEAGPHVVVIGAADPGNVAILLCGLIGYRISHREHPLG